MNLLNPSRSFAAAALLAGLGALAPLAAHAANAQLSGNVTYNTDVVRIAFSVAADGPVKVWTDSWRAGVNFDPVAAVWAQAGSGYTLLREVDDDDSIGAGQGSFDAGISFSVLTAGQYLLTVAASPNFAVGPTLAAGFTFDGQTPIALVDWNQPGYNPNANDQKGGFWQVNLTGIGAAAVVPEPSTWTLLALGLAATGVGLHRNGTSRRG